MFAALFLALCPLSPRAGGMSSGPLFAAPSCFWNKAIGVTVAVEPEDAPLSPSLVPLTSPELAATGGYGPVVFHLESQLKLTPEAFAALPVAERWAALELALAETHEDLALKMADLLMRANVVSSSDKPLDKEGRAELYRVVVHLDEMRTRYAPLLHNGELDVISHAYDRAFARALAISDALRNLPEAAWQSVEAAAAPAFVPAPVSRHARKVFASLSTKRYGAIDISQDALEHLLLGYGFVISRNSQGVESGGHRKYVYPASEWIRPLVVPRGDTHVHMAYVKSVLAAIGRIELLLKPVAAQPDDARPSASPQIDLDRLSVLRAPEDPKVPLAEANGGPLAHLGPTTPHTLTPNQEPPPPPASNHEPDVWERWLMEFDRFPKAPSTL